MTKMYIDVDACVDALQFTGQNVGADMKAFIEQFQVSPGGCGTCTKTYNSDVYPCDQCRDNPDIISHYSTHPPRLANYFIGAPVMVPAVRGPGDKRRPDVLRPYEGSILKLPLGAVRLPTVEEAAKKCTGLWLIPWPEYKKGLYTRRYLAWFKESGQIIEYLPGEDVPKGEWHGVKAIQILPELKQ